MSKHLNIKKTLSLIALLFVSINLFAQAPQKMSYQAVIRNSANNLVTNAPVKMRISILQGSATGTAVYSELHSATTNANGLVSIEIGAGTTPTGDFSSINWGNGTYYLKTETDPTNGANYTITGTSQLLSVPYALQANNAGDGIKGVSLTGDTLYLNNGKSIIIPGVSNANPVTVTSNTAHSCGATNVHNPAVAYGSLKDQEGNMYKTIQIGTQTWMAENLKTTKYRNGTAITNITDNSEWQNNTTGAYCSYNNTSNDCPYGKLYNWYAVTNANQICPTGWHVPSDVEFNSLIANLDPSYNSTAYGMQSTNAGSKMKSTGTQYWQSPNTDATNSSGFSGLPGGGRGNDGSFGSVGDNGYWWSSTENDTNFSWFRYLYYINGYVNKLLNYKTLGFSVRCVKN